MGTAKIVDGLEIDYAKVEKATEELKRAAKSVSEISSNKLSGVKNRAVNSWKGENSESYQAKLSGLISDIETLSSDISSAASDIEAEVARIKEIERKNIELMAKGACVASIN